MDTRLILTFATGPIQYRTMAKALAASIDFQGCRIPKAIITDAPESEFDRYFDLVLRPLPSYDHWFLKLSGCECTSADQILFLDGDSLAVDRIEPIFEAYKGCDFGVDGGWEATETWYGDFGAVRRRFNLDKVPKFSGGFIYYERTDRARLLIDRILELASNYDDLKLQRNHGYVVDEVCISLAMAQSGIGKVGVEGRQFSHTPWGSTGRVHLDVLAGECRFIKGFAPPLLVKPTVYHSGRAGMDFDYWREVGRILSLSERVARHKRKLASGGSEYARWKHLLTIYYRNVAFRASARSHRSNKPK